MKRVEAALTENQLKRVLLLLFGEDPGFGGTGALLVLCSSSSGMKRTTLLLREIIVPQAGDLAWHPHRGAVISSQYYNKALRMAQSQEGVGVLCVRAHRNHTQSQARPEPTAHEAKLERDELCFVSGVLGATRPVAGASITADGRIGFRDYTFLFPKHPDPAHEPQRPSKSFFNYVDRIRIVGRELHIIKAQPQTTEQIIPISHSKNGSANPAADLTIGIVGLGGVGGVVATQLAQVGVRSLVLLDYARATSYDLEHSFGVTRKHVSSRTAKVNIYSRIATQASTDSNFEVRRYRESILERPGLLPLLDCDIIVSTAEDAVVREVLDQVSYAHLIPVIDAGRAAAAEEGTTAVVNKANILSVGPGQACLECQGAYTLEEARNSRHNSLPEPVDEIRARDSAFPESICSNSLIASLAALRLLSLVRHPDYLVRDVEKYRGVEPTVSWGVRTCKDECLKHEWTGSGDAHSIPLGTDAKWKQIQLKEKPRISRFYEPAMQR